MLVTLRRWHPKTGLRSGQPRCSLSIHCMTGRSPGTTPRLALASAVIAIDASPSPGISAKRDPRTNPNRFCCTKLPTLWRGFEWPTVTSGYESPALLATGDSAPTPPQPQRSMLSGGACAPVGTKSFGLEDHPGPCRAPSVRGGSTRLISSCGRRGLMPRP
jgi:hypothetical protein